MKRSTFFLALFLAAALADLLITWIHWPSLELIAKPMIMVALIGFYFSSVSRRNMTFVWALFFCWAGDVLLMFQPLAEDFFLAGLSAFFIGQILYVAAFREMRVASKGSELSMPQKIRFSLPVILAGTGLVAILFPKLGALKIPVMTYSVALIVMVLSAIFRHGQTSSRSYLLILCGAILFMISDSTLALNKFYSPIPLSGLWIMSTYIAAQYLIVQGAVEHAKKIKGPGPF